VPAISADGGAGLEIALQTKQLNEISSGTFCCRPSTTRAGAS
jgi:hypothetical protein